MRVGKLVELCKFMFHMYRIYAILHVVRPSTVPLLQPVPTFFWLMMTFWGHNETYRFQEGVSMPHRQTSPAPFSDNDTMNA